MLKRVVHIAKNQDEARQWDIRQSTGMTPEERQHVVKELKRKTYGKDAPDVRAYYKNIDKK
jgi:hypothetical protein